MPLDEATLEQFRSEAAKALAELEQMQKDGTLTAASVCAWMAKWKNTATYKHLGLAMTEYANKNRP